jgi:hypothetical protein
MWGADVLLTNPHGLRRPRTALPLITTLRSLPTTAKGIIFCGERDRVCVYACVCVYVREWVDG